MNSRYQIVGIPERTKRRTIRVNWTCSDYVSHEHRWYWSAWLCGRFQQVWRAVRREAK